MPGPSPPRGPSSATGGHLTSSCPARRRGARVRATDRDETPTPTNVSILQWNAEGVCNKKVPLAERLHPENIDVVCLQETHLKENQRLTMRGCQVFRHDRESREGRTKGGVAILVRNSIPAQEVTIRTNKLEEIHGVNIIVGDQQLKSFNVYSPPDRDLSLDLIQLQDNKCLIIGDFNSHSETSTAIRIRQKRRRSRRLASGQ